LVSRLSRLNSGPKLWHLYTGNALFSKKLDFLQQEWTKEGEKAMEDSRKYTVLLRQAAPAQSGIIFVNNPRMCLCKNPLDVVAGLFFLA
jgi:hypothetical protein